MTADLLALLDQLDEARAKATPGPWWAWDRGVGWHIVTEDPATVGRGSVPVCLPEGMRTDLARAEDAALIVAAVNALPELIARIRAGLALAEQCEATGRLVLDHPAPTKTDAAIARTLIEAAEAITAALTPEQVQP